MISHFSRAALTTVLLGFLTVCFMPNDADARPLRPVKAVQITPDLKQFTYKPSGKTADIMIPITAADSSFLVSAVGYSPRAVVGVTDVDDPRGNSIYKLTYPNGRQTLSSRVAAFPIAENGEASYFHPLNPITPIIPGTYRVRMRSNSPRGFRNITVTVKQGLARRQALDLNIWVAVPSPELQSTRLQNAFGQAVRRQMNRILSPHGMIVGELKFFNANNEELAAMRRPSVGRVRPLCAMMQQRVGRTRALNIIWVDQITYGGRGKFGGISSGQPGSVLADGSNMTCVLASYQTYGADLDQHAVNFLHEGAHFMGLPHTTESDGLNFDKFTDTPECPLRLHDGRANPRFGVRGQRDQSVDDFECGVPGGANNFLFYGGLSEFAPFTMTPQQAWVLKRHPLFYPVR